MSLMCSVARKGERDEMLQICSTGASTMRRPYRQTRSLHCLRMFSARPAVMPSHCKDQKTKRAREESARKGAKTREKGMTHEELEVEPVLPLKEGRQVRHEWACFWYTQGDNGGRTYSLNSRSCRSVAVSARSLMR